MPNPKHKHTRARRDTRRAQNWKMEALSASACSHCGGRHVPHRVCPHCGFYDGQLVVRKKENKSKDKPQGGEGAAQ